MLSRPRTMPEAKLVTPSISLLLSSTPTTLLSKIIVKKVGKLLNPKIMHCPVQKKVKKVLPSRFHLVITWQHLRTHTLSSKQCALCVAECCKALTAPLIDSDKVATAKFEAEGQPLVCSSSNKLYATLYSSFQCRAR